MAVDLALSMSRARRSSPKLVAWGTLPSNDHGIGSGLSSSPAGCLPAERDRHLEAGFCEEINDALI